MLSLHPKYYSAVKETNYRYIQQHDEHAENYAEWGKKNPKAIYCYDSIYLTTLK